MKHRNLLKVLIILLTLFVLCLYWDFGKTVLLVAVIGWFSYVYLDLAFQTPQSGRIWNSDVVLELIYTIKTCITSPKESSHNDLNEEGAKKKTTGDELYETNETDTISQEMSRFKALFWRDFVKSWYIVISESDDECGRLQTTLDDMLQCAVKRVENVDKYPLIIKVIELYQNQLAYFQEASSLSQEMCSEQVVQLFLQISHTHPAVNDKDVEYRYLLAVSRFLLLQLNSAEVDNCYPALEGLSEILAFNVLLPLIDMMCETNWLHTVIIKLLSDEEIEISSQNRSTDADNVENLANDSIPGRKSVECVNKAVPSEHKKSVIFDLNGHSDNHGQIDISLDERSHAATESSCVTRKSMDDSAIQSLVYQTRGLAHSYTTPVLNDCFTNPTDHLMSLSSISDTSAIFNQLQQHIDKSVVHSGTAHTHSVGRSSDGASSSSKLIQHDVKSAYFSRLGLFQSSSPPRHSHSVTPDTLSVSSSVSSKSSLSYDVQSKCETNDSPISESPSILPLTMLKPSLPIRSCSNSSDADINEFPVRPNELSVSPKSVSPTSANIFHEEQLSCMNTHSPFDEVDMAAEYMKITASLPQPVDSSQSISIQQTESAKVPNYRLENQTNPDVIKSIPGLLFKNIVISDCRKVREPNSSSHYVLYLIEYQAWYTDDSGELVEGSGFAHRRYREFVNLQSRLEQNPIYKESIRGVKGPTKWFTLPLLDSAHVEKRRHDLQHYLEKLIEHEDINCSYDLREFLAYGGDSRIAFVKKAPELNVPRIDKFVARKMSVVKDRLVTALPTIPAVDDAQGTKRKQQQEAVHAREETDDKDALNMRFSFLTQPSMAEEQSLTPSSGTSVKCNDIGLRQEADGSDNPNLNISENTLEPRSTKSTDCRARFCPDNDIPLTSAILELAAQAANGSSPLITDQILKVFQIAGGKALECWLHKEIDELTSRDRFAYYLSQLWLVIWPKGVLMTSDDTVKSTEQLEMTKQQALRCLKDFFPDILPILLEGDFDNAVKQLMNSLESPLLNRHLIFCLLDLMVEELFPEITVPNFGQLALLKDKRR